MPLRDDDSGYGADAEIVLEIAETGVYQVAVYPAAVSIRTGGDPTRDRFRIGTYSVVVEEEPTATLAVGQETEALSALGLAYISAVRAGDAGTILALSGSEQLERTDWESVADVVRSVSRLQEIVPAGTPGDVVSLLEPPRARVFVSLGASALRLDVVGGLGGGWFVDAMVPSSLPAVAPLETEPADEGEAPPEGEGETPPPADTETPPAGEGEAPPEGEGDTPPPDDAETAPADEGDAPPSEGEGDTPPPADTETPPAGEGDAPPSEGEGDTPPPADTETPPAGEGDAPPPEGEGDTPAPTETAPADEGNAPPSEGEGDTQQVSDAPIAGLPALPSIYALKLPLLGGSYSDTLIDGSGAGGFGIAPSLRLDELQEGVAIVALDGDQSGTPLYLALRAETPDGPVVFHAEYAIPTSCTGIGDPFAVGSIAHGLVETGQADTAAAIALAQACADGSIALAQAPFPVSRHLPPGEYHLCIASDADGPDPLRECRSITVIPIVAFVLDFAENPIDFGGSLAAGETREVIGDFTPDTASPTIVVTGNSPARLTLRFSRMRSGSGEDLDAVFGARILRQRADGSVEELERAEDLVGGAPGGSATPYAGADVATFLSVCLQPGVSYRLDFLLTAGQDLTVGDYTGSVGFQLVPSTACPATLDAGESALGDDDLTDNDRPGFGLTVPEGPFRTSDDGDADASGSDAGLGSAALPGPRDAPPTIRRRVQTTRRARPPGAESPEIHTRFSTG